MEVIARAVGTDDLASVEQLKATVGVAAAAGVDDGVRIDHRQVARAGGRAERREEHAPAAHGGAAE